MLARDLHMTRAELVSRLSTAEFAHWIAFYNVEAKEREQAQRKAQNRAKARNLSARMSGG